ncbi:GM22868 [Drosophila sechellia]|uniref:GM22868 n=1 Tax=Drosophila sechellia TaxID=7238 RepID=B4I6L9_DROSE|nr:GM22868 [Drosophila sechellia]
MALTTNILRQLAILMRLLLLRLLLRLLLQLNCHLTTMHNLARHKSREKNLKNSNKKRTAIRWPARMRFARPEAVDGHYPASERQQHTQKVSVWPESLELAPSTVC